MADKADSSGIKTGWSGSSDDALPRGLGPKLAITRASLVWETLWPALLGPACLAGLYACVSLIDAWSLLPGIVQWLAFLGVIAGSGWFLYANLKNVSWPGKADALRRIEIQSGLKHRPLSSLEDARADFIGNREAGAALWEHHLAQMETAAQSAQAVTPKSKAPQLDQYALRAATLLLLASALVYAGRDAPARLAENLLPGGALSGASSTIAFDAWITPPAYTAVPPLFLNSVQQTGGDTPNTVTVPEGSVLTARVYGASSAEARLADTGTDFEPDVSGAHEIALVLDQSGPLQIIANGRTLDEFAITLKPDTDPQILFTEGDALSVTAQLSLAIGYDLLDDYGITRAEMRITLPQPEDVSTTEDTTAGDGTAQTDIGALAAVEPPVLKLPLPSARVVDAEGEFAYKDLTSHPWAGLQVAITLAAFDEAEQEGTSQTRIMRLPQRRFTDPVARAVIEQRQRLARTPDKAPEVALALNALTLHADRYYETANDYLPLRAAHWRLRGASNPGDLDGIYDLLWDIALHFEDGDLSLAEAALRDAQDALMDALANGAPDSEIERLMEELRNAMDQFLQALAQQQMQAAQNGDMAPMDPNMQALELGDLESMLDALQDLAQSGSREAARQLLSELRQMMENLATGAPGQMSMTPPQSAMNDAIGEMGEIMELQRALQDETLQQDNNRTLLEENEDADRKLLEKSEDGDVTVSTTKDPDADETDYGLGEDSDDDLLMRQQQIRQQLDLLREGLGESDVSVPSALDRAERAMRDAEDALASGDTEQAINKQGEAITHLGDAAQAMAEDLLGQLAMPDPNTQTPGSGNRADPLGRARNTTGPIEGVGTNLPDELDIQRARRILEELQRRAGDRGRPPIELDYLNRLLKRF